MVYYDFFAFFLKIKKCLKSHCIIYIFNALTSSYDRSEFIIF